MAEQFVRSPRDGTCRPRRCNGDDGAAVVEFALVAPFLFLILFGIIEFGYTFGQFLDVRQGAREGARIASVNTGTTNFTTLKTQVCQRMSLVNNTVTVTVAGASTGALGNTPVTVTVSRPLKQLTGFLGPILNGKQLTNTVQMRLERRVVTGFNGSATC